MLNPYSIYRKRGVHTFTTNALPRIGVAAILRTRQLVEDIPLMMRPEHPKPQFQRDAWLNLNGKWSFAFDFDSSGDDKGWPKDPSALKDTINVPFCPESRLSGVEYTDFIPAVWYHRQFAVPEDWDGSRVFLHFGAVDYDCRAWVNGAFAGTHLGGASSFSFDITDLLQSGENSLVICVRDDTRSGLQPRGKQCPETKSRGCLYTRTTGIWQTVWLEARPQTYLETVRIVPDLDNGRFVLTPIAPGGERLEFSATALADGEEIASIRSPLVNGAAISLDLKDARPWSLSDPFLYELRFELLENGRAVDTVHSYAGLRRFHIEGNRFYLNNEPIFLRLVLDQGFYPDGIWTAPSDEELRKDIARAKAVGFNGARLHQKVFEERFHYWADRLGYLTWGEYCDWGMDFTKPEAVANQQREWGEVVMRDLNHPSIVAWTPFNETAGAAQADLETYRRAAQETVDLTRSLDPTRPVNDASGYVHVDTDIYTVHDYEQSVEEFRSHYTRVQPGSGEVLDHCCPTLSVAYTGQPFVVDEYGGTWWAEQCDRDDAWGYGERPESIEDVYTRIEGLTSVLLDHPHIAGFCYTQITDVEQEQNGIYTYDRRLKFDAERLRRAFGARASSVSGEHPTVARLPRAP